MRRMSMKFEADTLAREYAGEKFRDCKVPERFHQDHLPQNAHLIGVRPAVDRECKTWGLDGRYWIPSSSHVLTIWQITTDSGWFSADF